MGRVQKESWSMAPVKGFVTPAMLEASPPITKNSSPRYGAPAPVKEDGSASGLFAVFEKLYSSPAAPL